MNKQEFIEKIKEHGAWCTECHDIHGEKDRYVKVAKVRELLEQLDEPQVEKVEVPDFVANYIETEKRRDSASIDEVFSPGFVIEWDEVNKWLYDNPTKENERRYLMAIRAYVYGYTVKPKRWVVKNGDKYFEKFSGCGLGRAWAIYQEQAYPFDDHAEAEAVATLVEGSVEEV